jgi:hypothetical protein
VTHKNLVNGANEIFQASNKSPNSQEVGRILFNYPYSNQFSRMKKMHFCEYELHPTWTPMYWIHMHRCPNWFKFYPYYNKVKKKIVQLTTTYTIHWMQRLTLDYLALNLIALYKHKLTYRTFPHITKKNNLFYF